MTGPLTEGGRVWGTGRPGTDRVTPGRRTEPRGPSPVGPGTSSPRSMTLRWNTGEVPSGTRCGTHDHGGTSPHHPPLYHTEGPPPRGVRRPSPGLCGHPPTTGVSRSLRRATVSPSVWVAFRGGVEVVQGPSRQGGVGSLLPPELCPDTGPPSWGRLCDSHPYPKPLPP